MLEWRLPTSDSSFVLKGGDNQVMVQRGLAADTSINISGENEEFDRGWNHSLEDALQAFHQDITYLSKKSILHIVP